MIFDSDWIFDYVNFYVVGDVFILKFFVDVFGWKLGLCLVFLFFGMWLYQNDDVLVYFVMQEGDMLELVFLYIVFCIGKDVVDVLVVVCESGMLYQVRKYFVWFVVQIFVQLLGGVVLELEVLMFGLLEVVCEYEKFVME